MFCTDLTASINLNELLNNLCRVFRNVTVSILLKFSFEEFSIYWLLPNEESKVSDASRKHAAKKKRKKNDCFSIVITVDSAKKVPQRKKNPSPLIKINWITLWYGLKENFSNKTQGPSWRKATDYILRLVCYLWKWPA